MLNRKQLILTGILLIIGLQLVGVTYGRWFSTTDVVATIQTGTLEVVFENFASSDWITGGDGTQYERADGQFATMFQTVSCEASLDSTTISTEYDEENEEWQAVDEEMQIVVTGAYPGYGCQITFDIRSTGTVPVGVAFQTGDAHPLVSAFTCAGSDATSQTFLLRKDEMISCQIEIQAPPGGDGLAEMASYPLSYTVLAEPYTGP